MAWVSGGLHSRVLRVSSLSPPIGLAIGERETDEEVGFGGDKETGNGREARHEAVDDPPEGARALNSSDCSKVERMATSDSTPGSARDEVLGVAGEMEATALPGPGT